jgi:beta-phosphoglucomutase-like phosphatase (HAD superfamily)
VGPGACLAIEDSERGLRSAKAAGIECWVIPNDLTRGADLSAADPEYVVDQQEQC